MKLPIALFIGSIFLVGIFVASTSDILATEGDILLYDNFNDKNLDGWTIEYGNWYVNPQGNVAGSKSGVMFGGKINTGNSEWDNYRIDIDMNCFQGLDGGIGFRHTAGGNTYQLDLKFDIHSPYYPQKPEAILRKTENGITTTLGDTQAITLQGNTWYHVKIETSNDRIKIWVQNNLIFDITDTGTKVKKGTLSLNYWSGNIGTSYVKFDNVQVTALAPPPPPRLPVIFIPGIGGSELKATQDIVWSKDDGHGGTYTHAYGSNENIWINQNEAASLGNDDYFDVLRLKTDGITPEADLSLTGNLTSYGYPDIDSFFAAMGYVKGTNFFVFPYDWRKDVRSTKEGLDALIESAKTASGQAKVNLVVHSMGGLVARYYISDTNKASKINKLIELGVPHLGSVDAIKALMYGKPLGRQILGDFYLGVPAPEVKDLLQNLPAAFQLLPSKAYFNFYDTFPFRDDRDIDNNRITGSLNYDQIKILLTNLAYNMSVFVFGETFHNLIDPVLNQTNGTKIYEINGTSQPTLGQIHETWWITWPVNLIPKTDEIFINGDGTVPLYSASLKSDSLDISGATGIYYVEQKHGDLVLSGGTAMQTVKAILNDDNSLPVEVKDQKIVLEGNQISLDDGELDLYDDQNRHCGLNINGEMEENIPDVVCTTSGNTKHAFVKKKAAKVKVNATRKNPSVNSKTTNLKIRTYTQDKISKTTIYKDIVISTTNKIEFILDPSSSVTPILSNGTQTIPATSEATGSAALDQTSPTTLIQISGPKDTSGVYTGPVIITLTGTDTESGILKIEYSLDNGKTVQIYSGPFIVATPGINILQVKSIDKLGNEEIPQTATIEIITPPTPTPSPTPTSTSTPSPSSTPTPNPSPILLATTFAAPYTTKATPPAESFRTDTAEISPPAILGVKVQNPPKYSDQPVINKPITNSNNRNFEVLILVMGGSIGLFCLGLLARPSKKSHK